MRAEKAVRLNTSKERGLTPKSKKVLEKIIPITFHPSSPRSTHVIHLSKDEGQKHEWATTVIPWKEPTIPRPGEPHRIDFAFLVRHAKGKAAFSKKAFPQSSFGDMLRGRISQSILQMKAMMRGRFRYSIAILSLLFLVPFPVFGYYHKLKSDRAVMVEYGTLALRSLQRSTKAALAGDVNGAKEDLEQALSSFSELSFFLDREYVLLRALGARLPFVGSSIQSYTNLLDAGEEVTLGNAYIIKAIDRFITEDDAPLTEQMKMLADHLNGALPHYEEALKKIAPIEETTIPEEYGDLFREGKTILTLLIDDLRDVQDLLRVSSSLFGSDSFRRYLLIFQNQHELRPTGGFIGSFAVLDVQKGRLLNLEVPGGGPYDLRSGMRSYLRPPLPLQIINKRWEFQDANWFPDFAASAEKLEGFFEESAQTSVDGVIALNASVLEDLLPIVGPIESDSSGLSLAGDDALFRLQEHVEFDKDKPKEVIGEFAREIIERLPSLDRSKMLRLVRVLYEAIENKEVQLYADDPIAQQTLQTFGWTGEIMETAPEQDYLMVVNTNLLGSKSDARVTQEITHEAEVEDDGSITVTLRVRREHHGNAGERFYGVNNISYLRVYVPYGATLLAADGFSYPPEEAFFVPEPWYVPDPDLLHYEKEISIDLKTGTRITEEFGKTVFGNWMMVPPGENGEFLLQYRLPFSLSTGKDDISSQDSANPLSQWKRTFFGDRATRTGRYTLVVQKQSGIESAFSSSVIFPRTWMPIWVSSPQVILAQNGATFETSLTHDIAYGVVMKEEIRNDD